MYKTNITIINKDGKLVEDLLTNISYRGYSIIVTPATFESIIEVVEIKKADGKHISILGLYDHTGTHNFPDIQSALSYIDILEKVKALSTTADLLKPNVLTLEQVKEIYTTKVVYLYVSQAIGIYFLSDKVDVCNGMMATYIPKVNEDMFERYPLFGEPDSIGKHPMLSDFTFFDSLDKLLEELSYSHSVYRK